jgi:hypothetical protein
LSLKRKQRDLNYHEATHKFILSIVAGFGISLKGPRVIDTEEKRKRGQRARDQGHQQAAKCSTKRDIKFRLYSQRAGVETKCHLYKLMLVPSIKLFPQQEPALILIRLLFLPKKVALLMSNCSSGVICPIYQQSKLIN